MSGGEIEVDPSQLGAGGDSCGYAADSARRGAERLGAASVTSGIFGDFAEAHQFQRSFDAAHQHHQEQMSGHHAALMGLSEKSNIAQRLFTTTDESGADAIGSAADAIQ